jgi:hypothetical protein
MNDKAELAEAKAALADALAQMPAEFSAALPTKRRG